jgi:hypothetical protein
MERISSPLQDWSRRRSANTEITLSSLRFDREDQCRDPTTAAPDQPAMMPNFAMLIDPSIGSWKKAYKELRLKERRGRLTSRGMDPTHFTAG